MSKITVCMVSALFACLISAGSPVTAYGTDPAVEKIQRAYEGIRDIKGSFEQKSIIKDLKRTDIFHGNFIIKMPGMMRWQYHGEGKKDTEVIINNMEMLIYQPQEKQVFRGNFDRNTYGQAPLALLGGLGSLEKEFDIAAKNNTLILKPKRPMGSFTVIEISLSEADFPIASMVITDKRANRIDISFKNIKLNTGIKDSAFVFSLPRGVSMYEYNKP